MGSSGCLSGLIYRHTTEPFDLNANETLAHVHADAGASADRGDSWKTLRLPLRFVIGNDIQFDWGDMSTRQAISDAGIETVHFADLEIRSILGIWTQRWLHVYGD